MKKKSKKRAKKIALVRKKCPNCQYKWIPRTKEPKVCPRCKTRLDWIKKK